MLGKDFEMVLGMSNSYFQYNECTPETVIQFMENFASMEFHRDRMFIEISRRHTVSILGSHSVMEDSGDHEPWLNITTGDAIGREIDWHYWDHYKSYLNHKGFPKEVVENLDKITTDILSKIEDPERSGTWDRRGLVMGSVQSGKTANYTGLIAKAIDAGYKMVIILTGVHNSLRSQTQIRVNDELVGYDSEKAIRMEDISYRRIGVSRHRPSHRREGGAILQTLTTSDEKGDFKKAVATRANYTTALPYVLVIKKHVSILKNLVDWLKLTAGEEDETGRIRVTDIPLLVIDDECDQASVNTKKVVRDPDTGSVDEECNPTKTNQRIRELLVSFDKSAYIGYTATPYANVFIHRDSRHPKFGEDIFPRNFIFNIPQPDNYVGASKIFGIKDSDPEIGGPLPILGDPVEDSLEIFPPKHKKDLVVARLPESLKSAIKEFVIVCAAKRERATRNKHNSMLIHVTRFTDVQNRVHELVTQEIRQLRGRISNSSDDLRDLRDIWKQKYAPLSQQMPSDDGTEVPVHHWEDIVKHLPEMVRRISVKAINGTSKDALLYKEFDDAAEKKRQRGEEVPWEDSGAHVIAIGGDKLSRGLTLEGLTTTYYLRPSTMYDTLMQMGRWFGYRPGYLDLCRIYTTKTIISFFQQIAKAEIDLRNQFEHMAMMGMEPEDFGLSVLEDPGMLMITNAGKRRDTQVIDQSFAGRISQTINFDLSGSAHNLRVLDNLVMDCKSKGLGGASGKPHHWSEVPKSVVCEFLDSYRGSAGATLVRPDVISAFIQDQEGQDLSMWDVAVLSKSKAAHNFTVGGRSVGCWQRTSSGAIHGNNLAIGTLLSPEDEWIDFDNMERKRCQGEYRSLNPEDRGEDPGDSRPPGTFIRYWRPREKGLLLIYPICSTKDKVQSNRYGTTAGEEVYGFAVSFPSDDDGGARFKKQRVRVNQVYIEELW